jgi:glycosyltransferase involved in cell wall biosynthesis
MTKGLIVSTSSILDEQRGAVLRIEKLLEVLETNEKRIFVPTFFKKGLHIKNDIYIEHFPLRIIDFFKIIYFFLIGLPITNIIYRRQNILNKLRSFDEIIFHLSRTYHRQNLNKNIKIDICESLSKNFLIRASLLSSFSLKKYLFIFESKRLERFENKICKSKDIQKFFISNNDDLIDSSKNFKIIPNKIFRKIVRQDEQGVDIYKCVFLGHIDYEPNIESVKNTANLLNQIDSRYRLYVVGRLNNSSRLELRKFENIEIYGFVESFDDIFSNALCGFSLIKNCTGMQNKVLDYFTNSLPAIVSKEVQNGLPFHSPAIILENEDLLSEILKSLEEPLIRKKLVDEGYEYLSNL